MAVSSLTPPPTKPTFVLVSGAWHGTSYWAKVVAGLAEEGYRAVPVALRSASLSPDTTFADDLGDVRDAIRGEVGRGCDVVVVAHSLGSVVGSSAIKGFAAASAQSSSEGEPAATVTAADGSSTVVAGTGTTRNGHVIGFVALATGFLPTGVCFLEVVGGKPPPLWRFSSEPSAVMTASFSNTTDGEVVDDDDGESTTKTFATIRVEPREAFYNDLSVDEGNEWVELLSPQCTATISKGGEFVYAGWLDDRAFPHEDQRASAQAARDAGANLWSEEIAAGHSPMLSRPAETTDFLRRAAVAFEEKASRRK
ncbi:hypothetical protein PG994_003516 [Apiospora phragmitis]|uniref:AB hydrolase-1 domain-containing protein n=1 Tax=Apiospora phragmitis TaxID=2905665 RepID=A0ABR1VYE1_9PEZI